MSDGALSASQYDAMAAAYAAEDGGPYNTLYERPAMVQLVGHVAGLDVLDAGCGAGQLTLELCQRGASVVGIDNSPKMIEIARERLGQHATFEVADLHKPLDAPPDSFDLIVASLVMHYIDDWAPVLAEFGQVVRPSGKIVLSTHHPTMDWKLTSPEDYFEKKQITETWTRGGEPYEVTFWRRPLSAMSAEIQAAGLVIARIDEPMPHADMATVKPESDEYLRTHPHFLFLSLVPGPRTNHLGQPQRSKADYPSALTHRDIVANVGAGVELTGSGDA